MRLRLILVALALGLTACASSSPGVLEAAPPTPTAAITPPEGGGSAAGDASGATELAAGTRVRIEDLVLSPGEDLDVGKVCTVAPYLSRATPEDAWQGGLRCATDTYEVPASLGLAVSIVE
ncbi:MAG: hypothetical protein EP329_09225 [Deltaproteobacteria bacterium]|nr:MAG: hypothetical protein EP329_09225 [Deltaproteobacteria bacterium]